MVRYLGWAGAAAAAAILLIAAALAARGERVVPRSREERAAPAPASPRPVELERVAASRADSEGGAGAAALGDSTASALEAFAEILRELRAADDAALEALIGPKANVFRTSIGKQLAALPALARERDEDLAAAWLEEMLAEPRARVRAVLVECAGFLEADVRAPPAFLASLERIGRERDVWSQPAIVDRVIWTSVRQQLDPLPAWRVVLASEWEPLLRDFLIRLAHLPAAKVLPLLREALRHESPIARFAAMEALRFLTAHGHLSPDAVVAMLIECIERNEPSRAFWFLEAIGSVGGRAGLGELERLATSPGDAELRLAAARFLACSSEPDEALERLRSWLSSPDATLRRLARGSLGLVPGEGAAELLRDELRAAIGAERAELLTAFVGRDADARDLFTAALRDDDARVREAGVRGLLAAALQSKAAGSTPEGAAAEAALRRCGEQDAEPELRRLALLAVATSDGDRALDWLAQRLATDADPTTRASAGALSLLLGHAAEDAKPRLLAQIAAEPNPLVRKELEELARRLDDPIARAQMLEDFDRSAELDRLASASLPSGSAKDPFALREALRHRLRARLDVTAPPTPPPSSSSSTPARTSSPPARR